MYTHLSIKTILTNLTNLYIQQHVKGHNIFKSYSETNDIIDKIIKITQYKSKTHKEYILGDFFYQSFII